MQKTLSLILLLTFSLQAIAIETETSVEKTQKPTYSVANHLVNFCTTAVLNGALLGAAYKVGAEKPYLSVPLVLSTLITPLLLREIQPASATANDFFGMYMTDWATQLVSVVGIQTIFGTTQNVLLNASAIALLLKFLHIMVVAPKCPHSQADKLNAPYLKPYDFNAKPKPEANSVQTPPERIQVQPQATQPSINTVDVLWLG